MEDYEKEETALDKLNEKNHYNKILLNICYRLRKKLYLRKSNFVMQNIMSPLQNKSKDLVSAAKLLHANNLYPAVAHSAYYCCVQLMKHIWLHSFNKTEQDLKQELKAFNKQMRLTGGQEAGTHEFLINQIGLHIQNFQNISDLRRFNSNIWQLKKLRVDADYSDTDFDVVKSNSSLTLSKMIVPILQKY